MRAKPSFFISVLAQGSAHSFQESGIENGVPETRGDAVSLVDPSGAVVVKMIFFHPPEERKPGIGKVQRVVQPLFASIALYCAGEHHRRGINGKQKADGSCDNKQRQNVFQSATDVTSIEWTRMVIPMERVKPLMQKRSN